jgi:hypothetical protein
MDGSFIEGKINALVLLAAAIAVVFFAILMGFALIIYLTQKQVPHIVEVILRAILAAMGGAFAGIIGGELGLKFEAAPVAGQATAGLAVFVLLFMVNPPKIIKDNIPNRPPEPPQPPTPEIRDRPINTGREG